MKGYFKEIIKLPYSVKFFIITEIIMGLGMGIWGLNLNLFLLSRGMLSDQIGLVVSVGTFSTAIFAIFAGGLSDSLGYKRCMLAGFLLKVLAMAGTAVVPASILLYLLRGINGLGDCFIMVCVYPYITSLVDEKSRNMVYGLLFSTSMLSLFLGNIISGILTESFRSYGGMILISAVIVCLVAILRFFLPARLGKGTAFSIKLFFPRQNYIKVYLVYELLGYCCYFLAYSMVNVLCKSNMGLSDGITGLVTGMMTFVSGIAIFSIPVVASKLGRARTNVFLMICLVFLYAVMIVTSGPVFLILIIVTAAMQCMMAGLIDGLMLGLISENEKGSFSGLKLLLQNTGTSVGTFLAGVMIKDMPDLSILYLLVCLLVITQLVLFLRGVMRHIITE